MNQSTARLPFSSRLLLISLVMMCLSLPAHVLSSRADSGNDLIEGTVLETMNAAGYTYVNLSSAQGPVWIAIPETNLGKGEKLSFAPGMEMKDFHSKSLDKTFTSIIFSEGIVNGSTASPHGTSGSPAETGPTNSFEAAVQAEKQAVTPQVQPSQSSGGSMGAIAPFSEISVEKADGDNSFTVGELYEKAKELDGTTIRLRGKVVKFNANIMGRNWLHLQDGTGDPMQNTHDLVVTTKREIGSPDVLIIEGTLTADKDFGAGYKYAVIIENATIIQ